MPTDIDLAEHVTRAEHHRRVGDALFDSGIDWGAVCYFYAAYHLARRALRSDPIFDDLALLKGKDQRLIPDDRRASRHKGRVGGKGFDFGVNDLLLILYPDFYIEYELLHQASIQVRYQGGLRLVYAEVRRSTAVCFDYAERGLRA